MTHLTVIWLPEKPIFKYPLAPQIPFESPYHVADFIEFSASWDSKTHTLLPYKRKRFFGWLKKDIGVGFECPQHRHDVAMIGYYGWINVAKLAPYQRNVESLENKFSGWALIGDNHDCGGDFLWAALWLDIIANSKGIEMWTRYPYASENQYLYSETQHITMIDFAASFLKENIKGLTPSTNPLSQPNAILLSEDPAEHTYIALPTISLEVVHEPL
jgi:hypothetical protein